MFHFDMSLKGFTLILALTFSAPSFGQFVLVTNSTFPNLPATSCTNTDIDVDLQLGCSNLVYSGSSFTISGSTITVNVDYTIGIFCLPAIVNASQTVSLGNIPAGNYSVVVNGQENGSTVSTFNTNLTVNSCCSATADFALSADSICPGDSVAFVNNSSGASSRSWYINNQMVSSQSNFGQRFDTAGLYTVKLVVNTTSCSDSIKKNIWVYSHQVNLGPDTNLCPGSSLTLTAPGGLDSLLWSTGTNATSIIVNSAGQFFLTAYRYGCQASDTINIGISNNRPQLGADTTICEGDTLLLDVGQNGATYLWQDSSTQSVFYVDTAGQYYVERTDSNGCTLSDTIQVSQKNCSTALVENSQELGAKLFPNPVNDYLNIKLLGIWPEMVDFEIYSMQGKRVYREKLDIAQKRKVELDLSQLKRGLYFLQLKTSTFQHSFLLHKN